MRNLPSSRPCHRARAALVAVALALAGCASLAPPVPKPDPSIPSTLPASATAPTGTASVADVGWRDFFGDPALASLIARALENNRDLRQTVLNVERARALYRIQRAAELPSVGALGAITRTGGSEVLARDAYSVSLGITDFELDLFGRVRDLSRAAIEQFFAQDEVRRAAQLSLVAEVGSAWYTLAADREFERLARATLENREASLRLSQQRFERGAVSALDVAQARTVAESARADVARFAGQVARDVNALSLLVGGSVDGAGLPAGFDVVAPLPSLPGGLPSEVLLQRPDVVAAEHRLRAANANIGAARAAFFPSIRLTASVGTASDALSNLFSAGTRFWSFAPQVSIPIFEAGRLQANLDVARADQDIAVAAYERAVQAGFRDVADALALSDALAAQRSALQAQVDAAARANELSQARYNAGRDSFLTVLDAQRTLYGAQQSLLATRLAEQTNRVTLYKSLGGGVRETAP